MLHCQERLRRNTLVMARAFTPDLQQYVEDKHRTAGVSFLFEARPQRLVKLADGGMRLHLEDGTSLDGDVVVAGVGMDRKIEIARQLGIDFDNGILVNEFGQSSRPDVFAAGDVAAFWHPGWGRHLRLEAWRHAINHGIAVGQNMCGKDVIYSDVPWFWTDQYDLHIQVFGIPQASSRTLYRRGTKDGSFIAYHLDGDDARGWHHHHQRSARRPCGTDPHPVEKQIAGRPGGR